MAQQQQRYHVIERIDAGGMAEVFKANSTSLQGFEKLVAIKRILPKLAQNERFVRMFLDEAKLSLHLSHTNCVQVFDLGLADGTYFIVMEFVEGVNLKHLIEESRRRKTPMKVEQAAYIGLEICKGLAHAHEKTDQKGHHLAIVHRDISPPNILLSREGEVKITDFGLAKAKSQVETTDPGVVKGKFGYLSPEAAEGEHVDARTDIFAVGILMWEMLTGQRLFLGETDLETLKQVRAHKIPSLAKYRDDVPHQFEQIIRRALTGDPDERYQRVKNLGVDLAEFMFSFGEPVTSFDIADAVHAIREKQPEEERTKRDKAVEEAVQQAVNRIVSLEEVDDLDRFMSEQYESLPDQGTDLDFEGGGDFEDPRMWADVGFGEMDLSVREPESSDAWEQRNLEELIRRRQTNPKGQAAPGAKKKKPKGPTKKKEGVPPVVPDDRTVEVSDMEGRLREDAMRRAAQMNMESMTDPPGQQKESGSYGQQNIQPVSDSVSQAMAQVQQSARQKDQGAEQAVQPSPSHRHQNRPTPTKKDKGGDGLPVGLILLALFVLIALAAGAVFTGVL